MSGESGLAVAALGFLMLYFKLLEWLFPSVVGIGIVLLVTGIILAAVSTPTKTRSQTAVEKHGPPY